MIWHFPACLKTQQQVIQRQGKDQQSLLQIMSLKLNQKEQEKDPHQKDKKDVGEHDENEEPERHHQNVEEGVKVKHEAMHEEKHSEEVHDQIGAKFKKESKEQVDFENFDQFEDAPNDPEEKSQKDVHLQEQDGQHPLNQQESNHQQQQSNIQHQFHHPIEQEIANSNPLNEQNQAQKPNVAPLQNQNQNVSKAIDQQDRASENIPQLPNELPRDSIQFRIQSSGPSSSEIKSTIIIRQAQKQRISSTFSIFLKYNVEYQKTVSSYKLIIKNVRSQLTNKIDEKKDLHLYFIHYFQTYIKINREFYERSAKVHKEQAIITSTNKLANIKQELKIGFENIFNIRKTLTDQMQKLEHYIMTYTMKGLYDAFEAYRKLQMAEQKKQEEIIDQYEDAQKSFMKLFIEIEKLFKKGMRGDKSKEDLFIWIVKFINEQKQYRQLLIRYGKTLIDFKKTFLSGQVQLFNTLQRIINQFKLQSRKVFAAKKDKFFQIQNYLKQIEQKCNFAHLCTITDNDYIKSVLQLQNRKEYASLTDQQFELYLGLPFFDRFVGNKKDLFKGAINKCFPLLFKNEELVHTISGNLVYFNRETDQCKDKLQIKNLNARLIAVGTVQFDQVIKGIVFSDSRTVRLKFEDNDRAEELICYLNEKDESKK